MYRWFLQLVLLHIKLTNFGFLIFSQSKCISLFVKSAEGFYKVLQVSFSLTFSVCSCAYRLSRPKSLFLSFFLCCNCSSFSGFLSLINFSGLEARPPAETWSQWIPSCPSHFESSAFYFFSLCWHPFCIQDTAYMFGCYIPGTEWPA